MVLLSVVVVVVVVAIAIAIVVATGIWKCAEYSVLKCSVWFLPRYVTVGLCEMVYFTHLCIFIGVSHVNLSENLIGKAQ